jgi:hypothetical protein
MDKEDYSDIVILRGNCNMIYVTVINSDVKLLDRMSGCGIKELNTSFMGACENLAVRRKERIASPT